MLEKNVMDISDMDIDVDIDIDMVSVADVGVVVDPWLCDMLM